MAARGTRCVSSSSTIKTLMGLRVVELAKGLSMLPVCTARANIGFSPGGARVKILGTTYSLRYTSERAEERAMHDDEPPPFLGTWPRVYTAVLGYLAVLIVLLYVVT